MREKERKVRESREKRRKPYPNHIVSSQGSLIPNSSAKLVNVVWCWFLIQTFFMYYVHFKWAFGYMRPS